MFRSDTSRAILSTFGALLLSTTCIVAAVGPAPHHGGPGNTAALHT